MDGLVFFGILLVVFLGLVVPILAVSAFAAARRQASAIQRIGDDLRGALQAIGSLEGELRAGRRPDSPPAAQPQEPPPESPQGQRQEQPQEPSREQSQAPPTGPGPWSPVLPSAAASAPPAGATAARARGSRLDNFERQVTSRWFVWLGAATLGLAGVFLVREAAERGWLGPGTRVTLGFITGLALVAAGEWVRRRFPASAEKGGAGYVPPALSCGGFLCCYSSLYAAGQLFDFLSPPATFAVMAAVSAAAAVVSILHGPFLALLGALGGFLTPALIATDHPSGWALFGYLFALVLGGLAMARLQAWLWMAWIAFAGAAIWSIAWFEPLGAPETAPLGLFIVAVASAYVFTAAWYEQAFLRPGVSPGTGWSDPWRLALTAGAVMAVLGFVLARVDDYGAVSLVALAALGGVLVYGGRLHAPLDPLAPVAAAVTIATLSLWHLPQIVGPQSPIMWESSGLGVAWDPVLPPAATTFLTAVIAFAAAYAAAGFAALWGANRPMLWAAVSTATPLLLLIAAYWRIARFELDLWWASAALATGFVALAMAGRLARYRHSPGYANALAIYAAAVTAAVTLALAMSLRDAWLSVAISLELPALAWIHRRLPVPVLRLLTGAAAAVLCARLAFNPNVLAYAHAGFAGEHWPIYGYGVPTVASYLAWRTFAREPQEWLDGVLRALTFGFAALLLAFEYRAVLAMSGGSIGGALQESACFEIGWLALAAGLTGSPIQGDARVKSTRRALLGLAVVLAVATGLGHFNPVWSSTKTGGLPIFNVLLLAYAAPAALFLAVARAARPAEHPSVTFSTAGFALLLGFAYVTLETRHAFRGADLRAGVSSDAESYAYSAVWLVYAGVLLAGGLWAKSQALRCGSLVVVMAAVLKVFVVDMDVLTGLWRVASFFGLGLCLVGIGLLYQRLVFTGAKSDAETPAAAHST